MNEYDAIILGAGAAGLFCAATAGQRGKRVLLLDHADQPGKKILISGGGRCNFTNLHTAPDRYLASNPHFAKSALSRYTPADFLALIDGYDIAWHEKTLGQLFCDGSAKQIVAMLLEECAKGDVTVHCGDGVGGVEYTDGRYRVDYGQSSASAPALVIATGGPSIPKMGATAFAYDLARQFGLKVVQPRPALVPLTLPGEETLFRDLSGVSTEIVVRCGPSAAKAPAFREAALFTHRGLSGPSILQISSYWKRGDTVTAQFVPDRPEGWLKAVKRERPRLSFRKAMGDGLPERLADALCERLGIEGEIGNLSDKALGAAEARLARWPFVPDGSEGFAKAEVTAGGIDTAELSSKTMEARKSPGLYAIGEAVDVTGWLGGYNFQWAWASARAAGLAI
ncbi:NAD(P)/FAD-dependent oxidoreductase [Novosphingobium sp. P6W]|uniref:NAD(P)/FAD-dependent oxidoreductase n=1 Tax=Novosphingobium sp. P6W TaxID=1609758 RepID=UPI0005C31E47|nr:NAD(P)/FAD-dependent oxidoreductase [Novosphingobium sp. P6W]AXB77518.1 NAD(P)/FAD-dependent oxidoreductase [Novosphingobium sp. P6W]KIS33885.1 membrane protein [Novosphingobium sp. P6W]